MKTYRKETEKEKITVKGSSKEFDKIASEFLTFASNKEGNLFKFLTTLSDVELSRIGNCFEEKDKIFQEINIFLTTYAISFQKQTNELKIELEDLMHKSRAMCVTAILALQEKMGLVEVEDTSNFWSEYKVCIRLTDKFIEINNAVCDNPEAFLQAGFDKKFVKAISEKKLRK